MNKKQKECEHNNVVGTETYGVGGSWDAEAQKYLLKQRDGGLNEDLECEDCGLSMRDAEIEFV